MKLDSPPLQMRFLAKKLRLIQKRMEDDGIDMWVTFTREGNEDPLAEDLRFGGLTWRSAAIIEHNGNKTAIVGSLETEAVEQRKLYDKVIGYGSEGASPQLKQLITRKNPKKIAVNMSYDEGAADGLTSGMEKYLRATLGGFSKRLVSAEDLAITLRARLVPEEVRLVEKSIRECEKIFDEAEGVIKPGRKDEEIHAYMNRVVRDRGLSTAWAMDHCPSVNVGNNPAGHVGYHGVRVKNGDFVKLDFGVKYEGYCSDIQRVYFVGPGPIPNPVKRMFGTAREANDKALSILKPGVPGYLLDQAGRRLIQKRGYPEYKHARTCSGTKHSRDRTLARSPVAEQVREAGGEARPEGHGLHHRTLGNKQVRYVQPGTRCPGDFERLQGTLQAPNRNHPSSIMTQHFPRDRQGQKGAA